MNDSSVLFLSLEYISHIAWHIWEGNELGTETHAYLQSDRMITSCFSPCVLGCPFRESTCPVWFMKVLSVWSVNNIPKKMKTLVADTLNCVCCYQRRRRRRVLHHWKKVMPLISCSVLKPIMSMYDLHGCFPAEYIIRMSVLAALLSSFDTRMCGFLLCNIW